MTDGDQLIEQLAAADQEWRNAKLTLKRRIEEAYETELHKLKVKRDVLAYQAKQAKEHVTRISREGLHTTATITAYQAIAEGEQYAPKPVTEAQKAAAEFQWDDLDGKPVIRFTPSRAQVAPLLPLLGIEDAVYDSTPELRSAVFLAPTEDGTIDAITEAWDDETGRHPVVALVMGQDPTVRRRIVEWAA